MAVKPRKIEWNAYTIFVPTSSPRKIRPNFRPKIRPKIRSKNPSKNPSKKSVQNIRPKHPSKYPCHFVILNVPIGFCPFQITVASSLNIFMGSMATLHEGCLQVYICSREGHIEAKKPKIPRPALLRKFQSEYCYLKSCVTRQECPKLVFQLHQAVSSFGKLPKAQVVVLVEVGKVQVVAMHI